MVDERLCFPRALRYAKNMCEEFFNEKKMWLSCKCRVERKYGSGAFKTVSGEMEFGHCMNWGKDVLVSSGASRCEMEVHTYGFVDAS